MASKSDLIKALGVGKSSARTGTDLEESLEMPVGNTNEPTRGLIADCITNDEYPIGSNSNGYFLIDSDQELQEVVDSLNSRIAGIQSRIAALQKGWNRRRTSKLSGGNWPK